MTNKFTVDRNKIWVIDVECDNLNDTNKAFDASPHFAGNDIVNFALVEVIVDPETGETKEGGGVSNDKTGYDGILGNVGHSVLPWLFCGHNIRFDLAYWLRHNTIDLEESIKKGDTLLWDTQLAEYLLSGQKEKMLSLEDVAKGYGIEGKLEGIREMWDAGVKTRDIDPDTLDEYVWQDAQITKDVALRQIASAYERGMLDFVLFQMRSLFVVGEYERNGMHLDVPVLSAIQSDAEVNLDLDVDFCTQSVVDFFMDQGLLNKIHKEHGLDESTIKRCIEEWFDINSNDKVKKLIFGGDIEFQRLEEDGVYKTGKRKGETKYKNKRYPYTIPEIVSPAAIDASYLTPKGKKAKEKGDTITYKDVSLDDRALDHICKFIDAYSFPGRSELRNALNHLKDYRDNNKIVNTYCAGLRGFLFDYSATADMANIVHGSLHVANTPTGRLTSSNPNMQNLPSTEESNLKTVFDSRFENGAVGVVDFKQLEVVALAYLSQDPTLMDDLRSGRDVHEEIAREAGILASSPLSPDVRRKIKGVVFGTIYGAGVAKLTEQSGFRSREVSRCRDALRNRYPRAFGSDFVDARIAELVENLTSEKRDSRGMLQYSGYLVQPTGRRIHVDQHYSEWYESYVWPFTQLRNYPVQSLAADIVAAARVLFYDTIRGRELEREILMVNEVHDEVVFDLEGGRRTVFRDICSEVEDGLVEYLNRMYKLEPEFDLPLRLEVGTGPNWKEAKV